MILIDDILDLDWLETGTELQVTHIPVGSIVRRAVESLATFGWAHGVAIWADAAGTAP